MVETFGQRLRRLRTERGITVVDLALRVHAAEGSVRQLETGRTKLPNVVLGIRIADALNVDPRYLALGDGESMMERLDVMDRRIAAIERRIDAMPHRR